MPKTSKLEKQERLRSVCMLKLMGRTSRDIISLLMTQYEISERQAKRYISDAKKMIEDDAVERKAEQALTLMRNEDLYQKAYQEGKWELAHKINNTRPIGGNSYVRNRTNNNGQLPTQSGHSTADLPDPLAGLYSESESGEDPSDQ